MLDVITMLLCFTVGSLLTLLAYTKGLQHNYDLKHDKEPRSVVKEIIEVKKQEKAEKEKETFLNELLNDPRDEV